MTLDPPGYFGKVPARGDFLSCRVPTALGAAWDTWLGEFTLAVREQAGAAWPDVWLTAPLWRFALGPGAAGAAGAAAGILIASTDRVGRMFPFTVLGPSEGVPSDAWYDQAEALVLSALDDDFDPASLDAALTGLGAPAATDPLAPGRTRWWCRGSDLVPPTAIDLPGLPTRDQCVAMVLGPA